MSDRSQYESATSAYVPSRRIGRPPIGKPVQVRLPQDLAEQLDAWARSAGISRPEAIRRAIMALLSASR